MLAAKPGWASHRGWGLLLKSGAPTGEVTNSTCDLFCSVTSGPRAAAPRAKWGSWHTSRCSLFPTCQGSGNPGMGAAFLGGAPNRRGPEVWPANPRRLWLQLTALADGGAAPQGWGADRACGGGTTLISCSLTDAQRRSRPVSRHRRVGPDVSGSCSLTWHSHGCVLHREPSI